MSRSPVQTVKIHKLTPSAIIPTRATHGAFGYDLAVAEPVTINPGETKLLPTGLALADTLPPGMAMTIWPRSSTFLKYQLIVGNSIGLVDSDYTGEIKVVVYNTSPLWVDGGGNAMRWDSSSLYGQIQLYTGTKIAQLVFLKVALPFVVETIPNSTRQDRGGFGSTGA